MIELSVVLLNFNGKQHLETFLPSVVKYSHPYEVIVVDNGSTDESIDFIKSNFPSIRIIQFHDNHGFCGGYNKAIPEVESEYVILLNTDVEVTENWIPPLLESAKSDSNIKAVQPKILDYRNKGKFEYAGAAGGYIDNLGYPFCRGRIFETIEEDNGQYDSGKEIFWASGSCLFIHRQTYLDLGGLDEDFFAHMEEIDLCWRIWNNGHKVVFNPNSTVFHLGGGTLDKTKPRKTYLNFRNGLSLIIKNERSSDLLWKLPLRIVLDWAAIFKFSSQSGLKHGLAIMRAHWHTTLSFRSNLKKRQQINKVKSPRYNRLIAWEYFTRRNKTFDTLRPD